MSRSPAGGEDDEDNYEWDSVFRERMERGVAHDNVVTMRMEIHSTRECSRNG